MPSSFAVTTPLTNLTLDQGQGDLAYTVTNVSRRRVRGRAWLDVDLTENVEDQWFRIEGNSSRTFEPGDTSVFKVHVEVPPGVEEVQPRLSLSIGNVEAPQEDYKPGPTVALRGLAWEEDVEPEPWWRKWWVLTIAAVLFLALLILVLWLIFDPRLEDRSLASALQRIHEKDWDLGGVSWRFDGTIRERAIVPSGTILDADVTDDEATLVIQHFHQYDDPANLGTTRDERQQNVDALKAQILENQDKSYPLSQWFDGQSEAAMTSAREAGAPVDSWGEKRTVSYDTP